MKTDYQLLAGQLETLIDGLTFDISILANTSALLFESLDGINWAGFYLLKDNVLLLGPFQGKVACTHIPVGKGVCGTAVKKDEVVLVEDVHQFPGHIACDSASRSEIVLPIHVNEKIYGVLDMDSPVKGRFLEEDKRGLIQVVRLLEKQLCSL